MEQVFQWLEKFNTSVNNFVWGIPMIALILGTGIFITIKTHFFQIKNIGVWLNSTFFAIFKKSAVTKTNDKKALSQFQALATALAATIGTGNITGVGTAIAIGGPGAVFWMWVSAFFGMMTSYGENVLGVYYRKKNSDGEWSGGAMYYLEEGLKGKKYVGKLSKPLSVSFSFFCIFASFGIGNMVQVNNIATTMESAFASTVGIKIPTSITGVVLAILAGAVILGGIKRIGNVTEKLVPLMALLYIFGTLYIFLANYSLAGSVFGSIFKGAFGINAVAGGISGAVVKQAVTLGLKRGVFSNEAGLGSSVMVNSSSDVKEPAIQGMWGIFEVFFDTIVVCSLTAFAILSTGIVDLETGKMTSALQGSALIIHAFSKTIHGWAGIFIAVATLLFAFSTILGWSFYGTKSVEYLFGKKATYIYKTVFVLFIIVGATMKLELAWSISDTLNGLMAIPNLIGILLLSKTIFSITNNFNRRNSKKNRSNEKPMLSAYPKIQQEQEIKLTEEKFYQKNEQK